MAESINMPLLPTRADHAEEGLPQPSADGADASNSGDNATEHSPRRRDRPATKWIGYLKRCFWILYVAACFAAGGGIAIGVFKIPPAVLSPPLPSIPEPSSTYPGSGRLLGLMTNLDVDAKTITISWVVDGCQSVNNTDCGDRDYFLNSDANLAVFSPEQAVPTIQSRINSSSKYDPYFYDPVTSMTVPLMPRTFAFNEWSWERQWPWDEYVVRTLAISRDPHTNTTYTVWDIVLFGELPGFEFSVNFSMPLYNATDLDASLWGSEVLIERSKVTVGIAMTMIWFCYIVNCMVMLAGIVYILAPTRLRKEWYAVPLAGLLLIPATRMATPGAPLLGTQLDITTLIPMYMLMASYSVLVFFVSLYRGDNPFWTKRKPVGATE